jgi:demethylmenaquinone methyltransferase/2-methoxy-6-polyprenyl-1,4-benzoquinol methylase
MVSNAALLVDYYAKRAHEYERIYEKPERQPDLESVRRLMRRTLAGHEILEVVCGTGYWTHVVSQTAKSIVATDINEEVLAIARSKHYAGCPVNFRKRDAFKLGELTGQCFTAGLAAHWWSHLRKAELGKFLEQFHRALVPGATVVFMDNRFVAGSNTPITRTDSEGNTYQQRRLENGDEYEVLKNFPGQPEVETALSGRAVEIRWTELTHYWFLTYRTNA